MLLAVTGIATLITIYSRDYMRHHDKPERGYERFHAYLALFVFAMCNLVLGGNFLLLYLGWEAVGLCSYLLIGFYYTKPSAAAAAKKAFLVNRVGDFGFGLGILLIYLTFGTVEYAGVFEQVGHMLHSGEVSQTTITAIALLLFCGACGKSAQLPLHVWLPDAMEGPSPVSALIHAATMVTAGVFMIARCGAIFAASATAMTIVATVGAVTALFAATIALVQTDMKRILAYSTVSQLGYMFLGVGVYAASSAVFHLFTHAFFKALLFLGAGSVMHAMGGIIDVRYFSGLRKLLPWTFGTFLIGSLALAGFPLFSGFFSKDAIIHHAMMHSSWLGAIGLVTAGLTAFYTFRMVFLAFFGRQRVPEGVCAHESGAWMIVPLVALAIGAAGAGFLGAEIHQLHVDFTPFHDFLEPVFASTFAQHDPLAAAHGAHAVAAHGVEAVSEAGAHAAGGGLTLLLFVLSIVLPIGGIFVAYVCYVMSPSFPATVKDSCKTVQQVLWNKYFVDEIYQAVIVTPLRTMGLVFHAIDDYLIDGLIWLVTAVPRGAAMAIRGLQNGALQGYAMSMVIGFAIILLIVLW